MGMLSDIGTYLAGAGLGLTVGTNLFLGQYPDDPDDVVSLHERPGVAEFTMGATEGTPHEPAWTSRRLQVMVRRADTPTAYPDGSDLIEAIWSKLTVTGITLSGTRYISIDPTDTPALVDEDKRRRLIFSANFWAEREQP